MTGWIGAVHHKGRPVGDRTLDRMLSRGTRKAPDRHRLHDGPLSLGWRDHADRPAVHVGEDVVVTLAGWFEDPEESPGDRGPARHHDPARIAALWARHGVDLAAQLDGEFALAVVERASGVVHLVKDRLGTRPLYWTRAPGRAAFSTELAPLLELRWVDRVLARDHLAEFLAFRAVHAPRTLVRDVRAVPPGHRVRIDAEGARTVRIATPTYAAPDTAIPPAQEVVGELTAAVERAVRRRLLEGASVGVYLSGGTGSTAIVAAARAAARTLRTWTVTVSDEASPESPFAGRIAALFGMEHHTVVVGTRDIADRFDDAVAALDHPIGNVAAVLQLLLAEALPDDLDEVLTGDGTDQLFGGRMLQAPAAAIARVERMHRLPWPARRVLSDALAVVGRGDSLRSDPDDVALREGFGGVHLMDGAERRRLLVDETLVHPTIRHDVLSAFYDEVDTDRLNRVLHAYLRSSLGTDTLPRVEATAAAAGRATGFPLLDAEVRRLAWLLPGAFKLDGLAGGDLPTRWLLRAVLPHSLPTALVNRPDRGLPRPLEDWLSGHGRLFFEDRFAALRDDPLDLWHATELEAFKRRLSRVPGTAHKLWSLFILDAWIRHLRLT